jgi:hypothetical protein
MVEYVRKNCKIQHVQSETCSTSGLRVHLVSLPIVTVFGGNGAFFVFGLQRVKESK